MLHPFLSKISRVKQLIMTFDATPEPFEQLATELPLPLFA
jgi:hypothetical protein